MRLAWMLLFLCSMAAGQSKQERGKQTIDEVVKALGGSHFRNMQDRIESGRAYSFYREQLSGMSIAKIYTRYLTVPNPPEPGKLFVRERQSFGKEEIYAVLFDEKDGWQITFRGARPMPEENVQRYQDTTLRNIFYILRQRLGEPEMLIEHAGSEVFENQPVELVNITDAEGLTVTVYIHLSTKLPVRQVFHRRNPKTKVRHEEVTVFSRYRDVGGVQWPYVIQRERDGEKIFSMFSESVVINQNLSDELFTLPANLKILPKAR